jgi:Polyketide cyclase / dehydrase and lipid transport
MAWTANTAIGAAPEQVMNVLTRPCAIASWAPVPFEVEGVTGDRLEAGSHARVAGKLAGKDLEFDVHVHEADCCNFRLTAVGPFVEMDVAYDIDGLDEWSEVRASIDVKGNGILGRFVAKAVEGFLASGALNTALGQLAEAAENSEMTPVALAA